MCGRFAFATDTESLRHEFNLADVTAPPPRYNVAPSQLVAAVGLKPDGVTRGMVQLKWGFVSAWADDPKKFAPINAKAETAATLPTFRESFAHRRCLLPATGFYEWRSVGGKKQPVHFRRKDGRPFAFAALWSVWQGEGEKIVTTALLTTTPNELVAPVHNRMPVILSRDVYAAWLAPDTPPADLQSLLKPFPADDMEGFEVGSFVGSPKNDVPECIQPV